MLLAVTVGFLGGRSGSLATQEEEGMGGRPPRRSSSRA